MRRPTGSHGISRTVQVILLFGVISLLGDAVYETARSANSQYLNLLQISAAKVGLVFGLGEFLGYFLRLIAGLLSDQTGKHWPFLFIGYGLLLAVPLIGLTMNWNSLIVLILMERIGKALRSPAKDTILSGVAENQGADKIGLGFAFGLQEALDQAGAFLGPLLFTAVFYFSGKAGILQYQLGYRLLMLPFVMLMVFLVFVYRKIKDEQLIPQVITREQRREELKPIFWNYTAFTFFCALGFVNFSIVGYHLKANQLMSDGQITLLYSMAMLIDAASALLVGSAYDRIKSKSGVRTRGILVLMGIPVMTALLPILTLSRSNLLIVIGMICFGIIMGSHETVMRSAIADLTPYSKRGTGYGVFNSSYGLALFGGSAFMGVLYDLDRIGLIIAFTLIAELIAGILYFKLSGRIDQHQRHME